MQDFLHRRMKTSSSFAVYLTGRGIQQNLSSFECEVPDAISSKGVISLEKYIAYGLPWGS
jgi:hypothetical protein